MAIDQINFTLYSVSGSVERLFWGKQEEVLSKGNIVSLSAFSDASLSFFMWGSKLRNTAMKQHCTYQNILQMLRET